MAELVLGIEEHERRAGHVRAFAGRLPGKRVDPVGDRGAHHLVPGRVEVHLVDASAVPVVGAQARRVFVGLRRPQLCLARSGERAEPGELRACPPRAFPLDRVL